MGCEFGQKSGQKPNKCQNFCCTGPCNRLNYNRVHQVKVYNVITTSVFMWRVCRTRMQHTVAPAQNTETIRERLTGLCVSRLGWNPTCTCSFAARKHGRDGQSHVIATVR
jgi:hypothetical protein